MADEPDGMQRTMPRFTRSGRCLRESKFPRLIEVTDDGVSVRDDGACLGVPSADPVRVVINASNQLSVFATSGEKSDFAARESHETPLN
jgi:hypothetical protein